MCNHKHYVIKNPLINDSLHLSSLNMVLHVWCKEHKTQGVAKENSLPDMTSDYVGPSYSFAPLPSPSFCPAALYQCGGLSSLGIELSFSISLTAESD